MSILCAPWRHFPYFIKNNHRWRQIMKMNPSSHPTYLLSYTVPKPTSTHRPRKRFRRLKRSHQTNGTAETQHPRTKTTHRRLKGKTRIPKVQQDHPRKGKSHGRRGQKRQQSRIQKLQLAPRTHHLLPYRYLCLRNQPLPHRHHAKRTNHEPSGHPTHQRTLLRTQKIIQWLGSPLRGVQSQSWKRD